MVERPPARILQQIEGGGPRQNKSVDQVTVVDHKDLPPQTIPCCAQQDEPFVLISSRIRRLSRAMSSTTPANPADRISQIAFAPRGEAVPR